MGVTKAQIIYNIISLLDIDFGLLDAKQLQEMESWLTEQISIETPEEIYGVKSTEELLVLMETLESVENYFGILSNMIIYIGNSNIKPGSLPKKPIFVPNITNAATAIIYERKKYVYPVETDDISIEITALLTARRQILETLYAECMGMSSISNSLEERLEYIDFDKRAKHVRARMVAIQL